MAFPISRVALGHHLTSMIPTLPLSRGGTCYGGVQIGWRRTGVLPDSLDNHCCVNKVMGEYAIMSLPCSTKKSLVRWFTPLLRE